jgi:hypothetical protein
MKIQELLKSYATLSQIGALADVLEKHAVKRIFL